MDVEEEEEAEEDDDDDEDLEDRAQDLLERFSVEAAVQDPCVRLSVQGV